MHTAINENQSQMNEQIRRHEKLSGANEERSAQLKEMSEGYEPNEAIEREVQEA